MSAKSKSLSPGLSVVVPVYNSETTLPELIARLGTALAQREEPFEAVLVNDGSVDGSWETIRNLAAIHPWVRGVDLMRNFGQHNALLCGIREARHDVVVTIDDDLQNPPEEISKLLHELETGYDVVYGAPALRRHDAWRVLASWTVRLALHGMLNASTARKVNAFRAFRTHLREAFADYHSPSVSIDVLLTWGTTRFGAVQVRHDPRPEGRSSYGVAKLLRHTFDMVTGFSTLPLRLASGIGFVFTLFGILVLGYVLAVYLVYRNPVRGFPFLASIIAIFSGAQLFALGMIGEYLSRMYWQTMGRPPFLVNEKTEDHDP